MKSSNLKQLMSTGDPTIGCFLWPMIKELKGASIYYVSSLCSFSAISHSPYVHVTANSQFWIVNLEKLFYPLFCYASFFLKSKIIAPSFILQMLQCANKKKELKIWLKKIDLWKDQKNCNLPPLNRTQKSPWYP